uniref:DUF4806 domain-containing protein n=1 Tax=Anopheles funestus TaxID=62324 RepID=A0A182S301_ANOFN
MYCKSYAYKRSRRLQEQINEEYDAEQQQLTINLECDSNGEHQIVFSTTTSDALLATLPMVCSDSEDSSNELPGINRIPSVVELMNGSSPIVTNMLTSLSKQIAAINKKTDHVQQNIAFVMGRLEQVEKKVGISLSTLHNMKVVVEKNYGIDFVFKKITNETEFTAFDSKLGTNKKYYEKIKKRLNNHIQAPDPNNRMHQMIDLIFDRTFMAQCSWFGMGKNSQKRIAFGQRKNILKLFGDIGSHKFTTINEMYVKQFLTRKLSHAKDRINMKHEFSVCHKR